MSNEEKILAELKAIRAELATVQSEVVTMRAEVARLNGKNKKSTPTPAQQREAFHDLINSISDEDAEEFGRMVEEMERQKGGML